MGELALHLENRRQGKRKKSLEIFQKNWGLTGKKGSEKKKDNVGRKKRSDCDKSGKKEDSKGGDSAMRESQEGVTRSNNEGKSLSIE